MKLLSTIRLLKELMKLHSLCESIRSVDPSFQAEHYIDKFNLPSGFHAQICIGYSTVIRIYSSIGPENYVNFLDVLQEAPYNDLINMLWGDHFFRYNYNSPLHPCIYRMGRKLNKSANTFDTISTVLPEDEDVLEPIIFQKMTQYSTNEVQSMVIENVLREERAKHYYYKGSEKKYGLSYSVDFDVLDMILEEDLENIKQEVQILYEELASFKVS